ncbi:MAG TPA: quinone oxidoreductase [Planctomycetaceae bacterium]|nr:quinone oxidoreductase [Planctomycetaceae bacterium]
MKAAFITECGPAQNIQYGEIDKPSVTESQVLVKVGAVSLNPVDTYIRNGANYWELPNPFVVGCDLAGTVEAIGDEVTRFQVGDRVWGTNQGLLGRQGTFAEYCSVDQEWLYGTPDDVSDNDAAACSLVGVTAHLGLFRDARIQAGETIFVHGGTGGVGAMVLQMAKAAGARVIATAGSEEKAERCRQLGADVVINYKTENELEAILAAAPEGVDVFWETLREPNLEDIVSVMKERGRIVIMAGRDARPDFPVGPFYVKCLQLFGFVMFKASADELRACSEDINRWLSSGALKAQISQVLPLSEAANAHQLQEDNTLGMQGSIAGKIVLTP